MERSKLRFQYTRKIDRIDSSYTECAHGKPARIDVVYTYLVNHSISVFIVMWNYILPLDSPQINKHWLQRKSASTFIKSWA